MRRPRSALSIVAIAAASGAVLAGCAGMSGSSSAPNAARSPQGHSAAGQGRSPAGRVAESVPSGAAIGAVSAPALAAESGRIGESVTPAQPLIVRTGSVTVGTQNAHVVDVFDDISNDAAMLGGFVASSFSNSADDSGGASLIVRVPNDKFTTMVTKVDLLGKVQAQSENGQDVTGESIDIQARLLNLKSEESALRSLLSHAGSIPSILTVQDQLFGVESDIEQLTAQENSLLDQVTYATLTVDIAPVTAPVHHPAPENSILKSLKLALHNTAVAIRAGVLALGWAFPALVVGVAVFAVFRPRRRSGRRTPAPSAPGGP